MHVARAVTSPLGFRRRRDTLYLLMGYDRAVEGQTGLGILPWLIGGIPAATAMTVVFKLQAWCSWGRRIQGGPGVRITSPLVHPQLYLPRSCCHARDSFSFPPSGHSLNLGDLWAYLSTFSLRHGNTLGLASGLGGRRGKERRINPVTSML